MPTLTPMVEAPFLPHRTERLVLRAFRLEDAAALAAYRSEPEVARFQSWATPFTLAMAERAIRSDAGRPVPGASTQIAIEHDDSVVGDVYVQLSADGAHALLGYTLAGARQGRGFAAEAVAAVVDHLLDDVGVHRIEATLDPGNVASAMVVERLGFRYEGRALSSVMVRGEWHDDDRYALLAEDRRAWRARPTSAPRDVVLIEIDDENAGAVARLATHPSQERFVSPMAASFRHALFPEHVDVGWPSSTGATAVVVPWLRAIVADDVISGFVMLTEPTAAHPEPFLWRLLIDRWHQRRGIGSRAHALVADRLRSLGCTSVATSWVEGRGSPEAFYRGLGYVATGERDDDEVVARLDL